MWGMLPLLECCVGDPLKCRVSISRELQELLGDGYTDFTMSDSAHNT